MNLICRISKIIILSGSLYECQIRYNSCLAFVFQGVMNESFTKSMFFRLYFMRQLSDKQSNKHLVATHLRQSQMIK